MEQCEDLNYDCNYNMFLAKQYITNLRSMNDRQIASQWIRKLLTGARTMDEMKLRNDFMYYLVMNLQAGELQPPFNTAPPSEPLSSLLSLLPHERCEPTTAANPLCDAVRVQDKNNDVPMLYRQSPDGGAFLAAQPIPKCGAYCYLAVVCNQEESGEKK